MAGKSEALTALRQLGRSRGLAAVTGGLLVAAAGCGVAALRQWSWGFALASLVCAVLALAAWHSPRHLRAACLALDHGRRSAGTLVVSSSSWSDAVHWHAAVTDSDGLPWRFEFVPVGWQPAEGTFEAELFHLSALPWPALVLISAGPVYPRATPQPAESR